MAGMRTHLEEYARIHTHSIRGIQTFMNQIFTFLLSFVPATYDAKQVVWVFQTYPEPYFTTAWRIQRSNIIKTIRSIVRCVVSTDYADHVKMETMMLWIRYVLEQYSVIPDGIFIERYIPSA